MSEFEVLSTFKLLGLDNITIVDLYGVEFHGKVIAIGSSFLEMSCNGSRNQVKFSKILKIEKI